MKTFIVSFFILLSLLIGFLLSIFYYYIGKTFHNGFLIFVSVCVIISFCFLRIRFLKKEKKSPFLSEKVFFFFPFFLDLILLALFFTLGLPFLFLSSISWKTKGAIIVLGLIVFTLFLGKGYFMLKNKRNYGCIK
jgi:uncharacterized membrane protein SirB2